MCPCIERLINHISRFVCQHQPSGQQSWGPSSSCLRLTSWQPSASSLARRCWRTTKRAVVAAWTWRDQWSSYIWGSLRREAWGSHWKTCSSLSLLLTQFWRSLRTQPRIDAGKSLIKIPMYCTLSTAVFVLACVVRAAALYNYLPLPIVRNVHRE